jgi:hypothetical protein
MTNQTIKNRINRELASLSNYFPAIPIDTIFEIVKTHAGVVVQEDGTPWSGFLCGEDGAANFEIEGRKFVLRIMWHEMPSGNYEITAYVS